MNYNLSALTAIVPKGICREHSPDIFLRPQNITTKHALYGYFGPLFPRTIQYFGPELNSHAALLTSVKFGGLASVSSLLIFVQKY